MATLPRGKNGVVVLGIDKRRPFGPGKFINSKVPLQQAPSGSILAFPDPPVMFAAPLLALIVGAVLQAAGPVVSPDESIGQPAMQTPQPTLLAGARLTPAGNMIAPHVAERQPAMPTPQPALMRGAQLTAAGSILAQAPRADALPTPQVTLTRVADKAVSPVILAQPPQADTLPTPTATLTRVPDVVRRPISPLAAALRADVLPTPQPGLLIGAILNASGSVQAPQLVHFQPAMLTPLPALWQGYALVAAGSILAQAPRADALPTALSTLIVGFNPPPVRPLAAALRADFLPTPQPALLAGASLNASGSVLAPQLTFFQPAMPTPQPALWQGYTLSASGSILAAAPRADALPTALSTITRIATAVTVPVIQSQAPQADVLPTPQPALLAGAKLSAAGSVLSPDRSVFQPAIPTPQPGILAGFNPPPVTPLAAALRADFLPTPQPVLLAGAKLAAAGSMLAPQLTFFQPAMPTPQPALWQGYTLPASGSILAASPRADFLPTPVSALLAGAKLTAAGSIVAPQLSFFQPAMPTPEPTLRRGSTLALAGTIQTQALRADFLPTPLVQLLAGYNPAPVKPISAALRADFLPTPLPVLLAGAQLTAAGTVLSPDRSVFQPAMPTPQPALWQGYTLAAAGRILSPAPRADAVFAPLITLIAGARQSAAGIIIVPELSTGQPAMPTPQSTLWKGFVLLPAGTIQTQAPRAEMLPTPTASIALGPAAFAPVVFVAPELSVGQPALPTPPVTLLPGYVLAPAGSMVRPPLPSDLLDRGFAVLLGQEPGAGPPPPPTPSGGGAPPFIPRQTGGGSPGGGAGEVMWVSFANRAFTDTVTQVVDRGPDWISPDGQQIYDINGPEDRQPTWWKQIVRESRAKHALVATRSADPFAGIRSATALARVQVSIDYARLARELVESLFEKRAAVSFEKTALSAIAGAILAGDMRRQELDRAEAELVRQRAELEAERTEWARWQDESLGSTEPVFDEPESVDVVSSAPLALIRPASKAMRWTVAVAFCAVVVTAVVWAWPKKTPAKRNRKRKHKGKRLRKRR